MASVLATIRMIQGPGLRTLGRHSGELLQVRTPVYLISVETIHFYNCCPCVKFIYSKRQALREALTPLGVHSVCF